jgi:hypothetical protein
MSSAPRLTREVIIGWFVVEQVIRPWGYTQKLVQDLRAVPLPSGVLLDPAPEPPESQICVCDDLETRCRLCRRSVCCSMLSDQDLCAGCEAQLPAPAWRAVSDPDRCGKGAPVEALRNGLVVRRYPSRKRPIRIGSSYGSDLHSTECRA